ncbi:MAG: hypothetical protein AAF662_02950 [Pseudomonadota bacterium]
MKIAIIEDQEDVSDSYRELIEAAWENVEIDQLFNEDQAMTALARKRESGEAYDLISLDIDLSDGNPELDTFGGFKILKSMGEDCRSTVLVVTGHDMSGPTAGLLDAFNIDVLGKPHSPADYLRAVRLGLQMQNRSPEPVKTAPMTARYGNLQISPFESFWRGRPLKLTLTQLRLLAILGESAPKAVSISKLKKALPALKPSSEAVSVQISSLRSRFRDLCEDNEEVPIQTSPGGAYSWDDL